MAAVAVTSGNNNSFLNSSRTIVRNKYGVPYAVVNRGAQLEVSKALATAGMYASGTGAIFDLRSTGYTQCGQSFTAASSSVINSASFTMSKTGSPTGTISCKLYAHSGTYGTSSIPTGTPLATAINTVNVADISTSGLRTFHFGNYQLTSGTYYVIVVEYDSTFSDNSNYVSLSANTGTVSGNACKYSSVWSSDTWDLRFWILAGSADIWSGLAVGSVATILSGVSCAIDSNDILHISFMDDAGKASMLKYLTYNTLTNPSTLATPTTIVADIGEDPATDTLSTAIAVDDSNVPHIVYNEYPKVGGTATYVAMYVNKVGGTWNAAVQVHYIAGEDCYGFDIAINLDNLPVISLIVHETGISNPDWARGWIGNANNASSFTTTGYLYNLKDLSLNIHSTSIAVDSNGNTYISAGNSSYIKIMSLSYGNGWNQVNWVEHTSSGAGVNPKIVPVGTDIYVFYEDTNNDIAYDIYDTVGNTWAGATVLETGTYNSVRAKWGFWVDNDSQGTLISNIINQTPSGTGISIYGGTGTYEKIGQKFVLSLNACTLGWVDVQFAKAGTPTDGLVCKIYTGSFEGTLIATSNTVPVSDILVGSKTRFTFSTPPQLASATTYYFVFERTGTRDSTNYYFLNISPLKVFDTSSLKESGTWTDNVNGYDIAFRIVTRRTPAELDYAFLDETATPDIWWNTLVMSTAIQLVVNDLSNSNTLDGNIVLTQVNNLTVNDLANSNTLDQANITQVHTIVVNDLSNSNTLDGDIIVSLEYFLLPDDLANSNTLDTVVVAQVHILIVSDLANSNTLDTVVVTQAHNITVADLSNSNTLDGNLTIAQVHNIVPSDLSNSNTLDGDLVVEQQVQAIDLIVNDLDNSNTLDTVLITQDYNIVVADLSNSDTLDAVTITQVHIPIVADLSNSNTLDIADLQTIIDLVVNDLDNSNTLDTVVVVQIHNVVVSDLSNSSTLDSVIVVQDYNIIVADLDNSNTLDQVAITQVHNLVASDLSNSNTLDAADLGVAIDLIPSDLSNSNALDSVAITQVHEVVVAELSNANTLDSVSISQEHNIAASDLSNNSTLDSVSISQIHNLTIVGLLNNNTLDSVVVTQIHEIIISDLFNNSLLDSVVLQAEGDLSPDDLFNNNTLDSVDIVENISLIVNDSFCDNTLSPVNIYQVHNLLLEDLQDSSTVDSVVLTQLHSILVDFLVNRNTLDGNLTLGQFEPFIREKIIGVSNILTKIAGTSEIKTKIAGKSKIY